MKHHGMVRLDKSASRVQVNRISNVLLVGVFFVKIERNGSLLCGPFILHSRWL